jgi:hypothetical protein
MEENAVDLTSGVRKKFKERCANFCSIGGNRKSLLF